MARFYGTVQGERGEATRLGHSSITTVAASWHGAIKVELTPIPDTDTPHASVWLVPWRGKGNLRCIYQGALPSAGLSASAPHLMALAKMWRLHKPDPALPVAICQWHADLQMVCDAFELTGLNKTTFLQECGALDTAFAG